MPTTDLYIDRPSDVRLVMQRNTTPKPTFAFYSDAARTTEIDVDTLTFEVYFADDPDDTASLTFLDAALDKNPEVGDTNVVRIPITQAMSIDETKLADEGFWEMFMTDASSHRRRIVKGSHVMEG